VTLGDFCLFVFIFGSNRLLEYFAFQSKMKRIVHTKFHIYMYAFPPAPFFFNNICILMGYFPYEILFYTFVKRYTIRFSKVCCSLSREESNIVSINNRCMIVSAKWVSEIILLALSYFSEAKFKKLRGTTDSYCDLGKPPNIFLSTLLY
jgi:hypothetical protein